MTSHTPPQHESASLQQPDWWYVAHESELRQPGDFKTLHLNPQSAPPTPSIAPVIVLRDERASLRVLSNICRHRNVLVCRQASGNTRVFQCPDHGWRYNTQGELIGIVGAERYGGRFQKTTRGLAVFPRVASYRGLVFVSQQPHGPSLVETLGPACRSVEALTDYTVQRLDIQEASVPESGETNQRQTEKSTARIRSTLLDKGHLLIEGIDPDTSPRGLFVFPNLWLIQRRRSLGVVRLTAPVTAAQVRQHLVQLLES